MLRNHCDVVVIGGGPAGLFTARRLAKMGKRVTVLERETHVGGKCATYTDINNPELKTEWGAVLVAPNYGVVLDAIAEKNVQFEESVGTSMRGVNIMDKYNKLSWWGKIEFGASFAMQIFRFGYETANYQYLRDHQQELPPDYQLPFAKFAEKYNIPDINIFMKSFVTAFGYGLMEECPAYCVMEYVGLTTIPAVLAAPLRSGLVSIKNGYQTLMERVAEDFPVVTSAQVTSVERSSQQVKVTYQNQQHESVNVTADAMVLAVSPLHWRELGMELTPVESECVNQLEVYRYPVAICKIDGAPAKHQYNPQGLERDGLGGIALFTTRDNRRDQPRLGTAYVNLPHHDHEYQFNQQQLSKLEKEITEEFQAKSVEIVEHKIWEDYMPTLPWEQRLRLEKEQLKSGVNTVYVGAYTLGSFEDVACVTEQATKAVNKYLLNTNQSRLDYYKTEGRRAMFFYRQPRVPAVSDEPVLESKLRSVEV